MAAALMVKTRKMIKHSKRNIAVPKPSDHTPTPLNPLLKVVNLPCQRTTRKVDAQDLKMKETIWTRKTGGVAGI